MIESFPAAKPMDKMRKNMIILSSVISNAITNPFFPIEIRPSEETGAPFKPIMDVPTGGKKCKYGNGVQFQQPYDGPSAQNGP